MILASTSLAALVVALPLGQLADRIGARGVTIASALLFTLATLGQGLANEFWTLLLARGAFGLAFGALWGAGAAWLSDSLTEERRAGALAAAATVAGLGFTVVPVFAGTVADRFYTGTPFLILAVAAAAVTAALVIAAPAATGEVTRQPLREVVLGAARCDELVLAAIGIIVLIGIVGGESTCSCRCSSARTTSRPGRSACSSRPRRPCTRSRAQSSPASGNARRRCAWVGWRRS